MLVEDKSKFVVGKEIEDSDCKGMKKKTKEVKKEGKKKKKKKKILNVLLV